MPQIKSSQTILEKSNEEIIGEDLEKLFAFQDKHLTREKKTILVKALLESQIPTGAIILGLRYLMNDDLSSIKMMTIIHAARMHIEPSTQNQCGNCSEGFVVMKDGDQRSFVLSCQCGFGMMRRQNGLVQWKGEDRQYSNNRYLSKVEIGLSR